MRRILVGLHLTLLSLFAIHAGEQVVRLVVKIVHPSGESVEFWNPGPEMIVVGLAFVSLLGIMACSAGIVRRPPLLLLSSIHGLWLVCLTWFGWSTGGPFRLHELVGVNFSDVAAVSRAQTVHLLQSAAVYVVIVLVSSIPLLMRWRASRRVASGPQDSRAG